MKTRVITAVLSLPLLIVPIILGGIYVYVLLFLISSIGMYELLRAYQIKQKAFIVLGILATLCYYVTLWLNNALYDGLLITLFLALLLVFYVLAYPKIQFQTITITFGSFFYVTYSLSHIVLIRESESLGLAFVWLVFLIGFGSDTFAYFVGRAFGKHKLAKILSPKKTIEGSIGGILGAIILTVGYGYFMYLNGTLEDLSKLGWLALLGGVGSIVSQLGDLVASAIKRQTAIKDFGNLLPGHGGIIDRFDSNIFTAPFVYYIMSLFIIN